ncbi:MAG: hypothetical protein ABJL99_15550 [Aliishimia sp.]
MNNIQQNAFSDSGQVFVDKYLLRLSAEVSDPEADTWRRIAAGLRAANNQWTEAITEVEMGIVQVKSAIRKAYAPYPEQSAQVETSLSKLDAIQAVLTPAISQNLVALLSEDDPERRKTMAAKTLVTVNKSTKILTNHPFAKVIDNSGFIGNVTVIGPALATLKLLRGVLSYV